MWKTIKIYILAILVALAGYFLLSYHIIYFGASIEFLKKKRLTSSYTFFWAAGKSAEEILVIDTLREAGIGDIMVKKGKINEERKEFFEEQFTNDPIYH